MLYVSVAVFIELLKLLMIYEACSKSKVPRVIRVKSFIGDRFNVD
jgi:hypothetical protein